jgi:DNA-binding CsgD family transcriptional regulator
LPNFFRSQLHGNISTNTPFPLELNTVGALVVPMRARNAMMGTLAVFDWNTRIGLSESDAESLQTIADRLALCVEHVHCHRAAIDRLERLTAIRNVGLAVSSSQDLRLTLEVILRELTAKLEIDAADVLLLDEVNNQLFVATKVGFHSGSMPDFHLRIRAELMNFAALGGPIDGVSDPGWTGLLERRSLFAREGFQNYRAVPLMSRSRLVGILEVFHRSILELDQERLSFMDAMAINASIAIDNAAMSDRLQRARPDPAHPQTPRPDFSPLEWQILALMVEGASNREIADKVHLSANTIKFHVRQILTNTGADNRTEVARKATQRGWL